MDAAGAIELLMPALQPAELWKESGRWRATARSSCASRTATARLRLAPTHEEVITDLVRDAIKSYRQLPVNLYQIQTKFRDELRPRFGLMRGREFLMKDAYSFDADAEALNAGYDEDVRGLLPIFDRCGARSRRRRGRDRPHRRRRLARVHGPRRVGRGRGRVVPELRATRANMEKADVEVAVDERGPRADDGARADSHARQKTIEEVGNSSASRPRKLVKTLVFDTTTAGDGPGARRPRSQRDQDQEPPGRTSSWR